LPIRVIPRAGRTGIAGIRGDALAVRLAAAPVDGAANDALVTYLADLFGLPRRSVTILSGRASRDKRVAFTGLTDSELTARLNDILSA
jgi:hypothetical protein